MALQFIPGQVAIADPNPGGPTALSQNKHPQNTVIKLSGANFTTGGSSNLVSVLPADAMITAMSLWIKTQLAGNSISAATISIGLTASGTDFVSALTAFAAAGTRVTLTPITGIYQNYQIPLGTDLRIYVTGTSTTGNPTSGEMYLEISYIR